jgi:hypothetical protein
MGHHKLVLDDDFKEEFSLIALHCSEEDYKMAYLLNKHLNLGLKREAVDLNFSNDHNEARFSLFHFNSSLQYTSYDFVSNKCKSLGLLDESSGGLFGEEASEKNVTTYLLPEFKKVDFFLKIYSEFSTIPLRNIIASINEINQVISAYEVNSEKIKSKNNLIFD